ncbi:Gfo/Idh/MocA family oxidoreductase [Salinimonas sp. HHU 13199]|uniref:Gfo/Idh/MocA family oxidoreductase n=1 Tax=Salinimonas profundi TaxID=2729140 RepID=A0ABR8LK72_9ALTE|nr:Gfo/Idh/MocA family oxidoreductase [Salinimonas profundi]MBD3585341.1 Gfo/Idh/MocA family oxidoreductase [Salinimonas profundi]
MSMHVVVVGIGNIAQRHRANIKKMFSGATVYALSSSGRTPDTIPDNCDVFLSCFDAIPFTDIDVAIIASPAPFHKTHALVFIEKNIPTLIEKPVATNVHDVEEIMSASSKNRTPVGVGYCLRFLSSAGVVKKLISDNRLGEIYNVIIETGQHLSQWRPGKDYTQSVTAQKALGGGALFELSHEFDYCQWIFGALTLRHAIVRSSGQLNLDVEDQADIVASLSAGGVVNIHLDLLQHQVRRTCRVIGSEGTLEWDLVANKVVVFDKQGERIIYADAQWDKNSMYIAMLNDFISNTDNEHTVATLAESLSVIRLINDIKQIAQH